MFKSFHYIFQANQYLRLPKIWHRVVFYSEGKNYWPLFEGLITGILDMSELNICYVSSEDDDPGLYFKDNRFKSFLIDDSYVRNWFFENLQADVFIMTMPDLNNYQVKRSKHPVHYIYIQHNLMSLHMSYRHGAFDWFDSVFCAGPHHVNEIRYLEKKYNSPKKNILEHGYARLDSIISNKQKIKTSKAKKHVLFAPSWGPNAAIESGLGDLIIEKFLSLDFKVTFRPHPETIKNYSKIIQKIISKYSNNEWFVFEKEVSSLSSFHDSDLMISDWSGAALEYSFGLNKPVIFLDLPKKINNPFYEEINIIPLEVSIRNEIGIVASIEQITSLLIDSLPYGQIDPEKYVFNVGKSDYYGVKYILDLLKKLPS